MKEFKINPIKDKNLQDLVQDLFPRKFARSGVIWMTILTIFFSLGIFFYIQQLRQGLSLTDLSDYNTWGIYVSNFVFFVAISLVGSLISAILKLTGAKWRTPLTRVAEIIAVAAIIFAGLVIIIDMGRPDRMLNLLIHGRIQSPITWDVIVISTYLMLSILFLYLPLIPDFALMRDRYNDSSPFTRKIYRFLAVNWTNSESQQSILKKAIKLIAIIIIPVAFGIHTVTSWLFATTFRPGWDSSNFGPYFVSGAFMVGAASVICGMYIFRKFYNYEKYFTDKHFDYMSRLLVLLSLIYLYFNINEYFVPAYKMKASEAIHLNELFYGAMAPLFWSVQIGGMVIPIIVLFFKKGRTPLVASIISILVVVGAWFKRFLIVVPTLEHPLIPSGAVSKSLLVYLPTIPEWFITIGTLAGALLIITILVRFLPIIPIVETVNEHGYNTNDLFENYEQSETNEK